jgi:hypothetical protein
MRIGAAIIAIVSSILFFFRIANFVGQAHL